MQKSTKKDRDMAKGYINKFKKVSHSEQRKTVAKDAEKYKQKPEKSRQEQLAFLAKQAQELNLGYR